METGTIKMPVMVYWTVLMTITMIIMPIDESNDDDAKGDDVMFSIRIMIMIYDDYVDGFGYNVDNNYV